MYGLGACKTLVRRQQILMIDREIDIATADGQMNTFVTRPEGPGPFPTLIFLMDAPGKREELHDMARRLGTVGYSVLLPNLYYRKTRNFRMDFSEAGMKAMFDMTRHLSIQLVMEDVKVLLARIATDPLCDAARTGALGYCMSGPFVFAAMGRFAQQIRCGASIYGANLITDRDDSPHLTAGKIEGEIYFACAEIDQYAPKEVIQRLTGELEAAKTNYRLEWYPAAEHGFAFPGRRQFHKPSAERHWERLFDLFERNLKACC